MPQKINGEKRWRSSCCIYLRARAQKASVGSVLLADDSPCLPASTTQWKRDLALFFLTPFRRRLCRIRRQCDRARRLVGDDAIVLAAVFVVRSSSLSGLDGEARVRIEGSRSSFVVGCCPINPYGYAPPCLRAVAVARRFRQSLSPTCDITTRSWLGHRDNWRSPSRGRGRASSGPSGLLLGSPSPCIS